jgi:hypothetical protein
MQTALFCLYMKDTERQTHPDAILEQNEIDKPEFLRLPKPYERCRFTGLSRPSLEELCIPSERNDFNPPVKSLLLKKRGATRGIRLVNFDSLLGYLHKLEAESQFNPRMKPNTT